MGAKQGRMKGNKQRAESAEPEGLYGKPDRVKGEDPQELRGESGALGKPLGGGTDGGLKGRTGS